MMMSVTKTNSVTTERMENDRLSRDFIWSIFISAVNNYRHDTVVRPFPPLCVTESGEKDFQMLKEIANGVTSLDTFPTPECETLVKWVTQTKHFSLKLQSESKFTELMQQTGQIGKTSKPTQIFEIIHDKTSEEKFKKIKGNLNTFYAYHGSRLENFHSILHNGLQNHLNKNSLFGDGTYVSTDLTVCMIYSPSALSWHYSTLGDHMSCVAVCEIIDHPNVKSQIMKPKSGSSFRLGLNGIPEKYYVIQNDELVRLKYIFVFSSRTSRIDSRTNSIKTWLYQHGLGMIMLIYVALLVGIGFCNSRSFNTFYHKHFTFTE